MATDPLISAREAGLRYTGDDGPGIRRTRRGRGFTYATPDGRSLRNTAELRRIRRLAIPPAWTDVWISPDPLGHIQATGRDARGRKQYRYHERWRESRDADKYAHLVAFARALPALRRRIRGDLAAPGLSYDKVLACVIALLESGVVRVGNEEYARVNRSFGLTTLRTHHATVRGPRITFRFRGKGGKRHEVRIVDERLARVVRRTQEMPGQELFEYADDEGGVRRISSGDVNDRLRSVCGTDLTAKDFRTWRGTVLMARTLAALPEPKAETRGMKKRINEAIAVVAAELGNTPAVARKAYIHPAVIEAYEKGTLRGYMERARAGRGLRRDEAAVLRLIENARASESRAA